MGFADEILIVLGMLVCGIMGYLRSRFDHAFGAAFALSLMHLGASVVEAAEQTPPVYLPAITIGSLGLTFLIIFLGCWWVGNKLPRDKA